MHGNFNSDVKTIMTTIEESEPSINDSRMTNEDTDDNNVVKLELDISVPSFEVELMKLKLVPGIN